MDKSIKNDKDDNRDRVIEARFDNLTETEQDKLREAMAKAKREHAPESRATIIEGTQKQLPGVKPKQLGE